MRELVSLPSIHPPPDDQEADGRAGGVLMEFFLLLAHFNCMTTVNRKGKVFVGGRQFYDQTPWRCQWRWRGNEMNFTFLSSSWPEWRSSDFHWCSSNSDGAIQQELPPNHLNLMDLKYWSTSTGNLSLSTVYFTAPSSSSEWNEYQQAMEKILEIIWARSSPPSVRTHI